MHFLNWPHYNLSFIRQRYNSIAPFFPLFEWLFLLPPGIRSKAVDCLKLRPGDRVLEIGCGTGRNLSLLQRAVGPLGHIYGVDLSEGMLSKARQLCQRQGWSNVTLTQCDAADYSLPEAVDGVIFSLSYATMPHHQRVLRQSWNQLQQGKYLVIMDSKLPDGVLGKALLPYGIWIMKRTVLGNPYLKPWEELHELTADFEMRELLFGAYYICQGRKQSQLIKERFFSE